MATNNNEVKETMEHKIDEMTGVPNSILNKLYNKEDKKLFLKEYLEDEATREMYAVYMISLGTFENLIGKDLYNFSSKDILDYFSTLYTTSATSMRASFSTAKQYVNWANARGFNRTGTNPFSTLDFKNDILTMLNLKNIEKRYITEKQVWEIGNDKRTINVQDFICIILPFYGIKGQLCSEIVNLKREDVDGVHDTITLVNKIIYEDPKAETKVVKDIIRRTIPISKELIKIIEDADDQETYYRRGNAGFGDRTTAELNTESEFVVKPTLKNSFQITAQSIATRAKKNLKDVGYGHMSINDLVVSGKISALRKIEEEKGFLEINDYKLIQDRFGEDFSNYANIKLVYETFMKATSKTD
jgi:integrase